MHRIHQLAEQMLNGPGITWREVIVGFYTGMLPNSMCEEPYIINAEFDSAVPLSESEITLSGMLWYSTNPTLGYQIAFTATICTTDRAITIIETEGKPEERHTYRGHISTNGRLISLTAYWADTHCPENFYLVHEDTVGTIMEHDNNVA
jgi:hypothetical protein